MKVIELIGPAVGGIRVHVADLARRLRQAGVDVVVAGPVAAAGADPPDHRVPVPGGADPLAAARAAAALRRVPGDLVHAHGLKAGWVAVLSARRRPVVLTVHNLVIEESAGRSTGALRRLEHALLRRVAHVIAPNEEIARTCRAAAPDTAVSVIIPCAPDPRPVRDRAAVRASLGVGPGVPLVVVVARLHPQKDLPTFLHAFARLRERRPGVRAVVVGEGPLHDALDRDLRERGLAGDVVLLGARDDVADVVVAADVVALSSRWEAIPLVVTEAMLLGRPVVSTDVGIVRQLVVDGENGFVVPVGDATAMAEALDAVLSDPDPGGLSDRAVAAARGLVGGDHLAAEVADVYREALRRTGTGVSR